jgi:hypothetical protein
MTATRPPSSKGDDALDIFCSGCCGIEFPRWAAGRADANPGRSTYLAIALAKLDRLYAHLIAGRRIAMAQNRGFSGKAIWNAAIN